MGEGVKQLKQAPRKVYTRRWTSVNSLEKVKVKKLTANAALMVHILSETNLL